jgi:arsenate reductase-like glutaredoxin family protein
MKNVTLYHLPDSDASKEARAFLDSHRVAYNIVDVSDPKNAQKLLSETKQLTVPVLTVGKEAVVGFEPNLYENLLKQR